MHRRGLMVVKTQNDTCGELRSHFDRMIVGQHVSVPNEVARGTISSLQFARRKSILGRLSGFPDTWNGERFVTLPRGNRPGRSVGPMDQLWYERRSIHHRDSRAVIGCPGASSIPTREARILYESFHCCWSKSRPTGGIWQWCGFGRSLACYRKTLYYFGPWGVETIR